MPRLAAALLAERDEVRLAALLFFGVFLFADGRLAADAFRDDFLAGVVARFADDFFADFVPGLLPRAFDPLRLPLLFPPDFPRDFLARVAMVLLLGVGVDIDCRG
ncbi:MAG TPA: hypothetical protein VII52_16045 [Gemmatimonadaceae bacterium]